MQALRPISRGVWSGFKRVFKAMATKPLKIIFVATALIQKMKAIRHILPRRQVIVNKLCCAKVKTRCEIIELCGSERLQFPLYISCDYYNYILLTLWILNG